MTDLVYVTNNTDKDLYAEYNYVGYEFPVGKTVELTVPAAMHMLGYGDEDKEKYLVQLGMIRLHSELEEAMENLKKVYISSEPPTKNRSLPSAVGVVPLHVEKRGGGNTRQRVA